MKPIIAIVIVLLALIVSASVFTVREDQFAVLFRFGQIQRVDYGPGLHFKLPVINQVRKFEKRILTLDTTPDRFITSEKKDVIVDSFIQWRISNVADYYTATQGNERTTASRLTQIIADGLRAEFSRRTLQEVVSSEREAVINRLLESTNQVASNLGVTIVDVRIKRIDLPEEVSESVYSRMRAERLRVANELRSEGREAAERIRADADRQVQVLIALGQRDAERIRGEGEARAAETFAAAFNQDREFYSFYRSLQAYRSVFRDGNDIMVLDPKSEFFRHFNTLDGQR